MTDKVFDMDAFIAGSFEGAQLATQAHIQTFGFDKIETWNLDQDKGIIDFTLENGLMASAPAQIIGTYSDGDSSFMWGWDHPSVVPALQAAATKVREFGLEHSYNDFTNQIVECEQLRAWEFTAVAMRLSNLCGIYRGPAGDGIYAFIAFGDITLKKQSGDV